MAGCTNHAGTAGSGGIRTHPSTRAEFDRLDQSLASGARALTRGSGYPSHASASPDECQRLGGDLPPAAVDRQRVAAVLDLEDLGDSGVALLLLERAAALARGYLDFMRSPVIVAGLWRRRTCS